MILMPCIERRINPRQSQIATISSEYSRELIRCDQGRRQFKAHVLAGIQSGIEGSMDAAFFTVLRQRGNLRLKQLLAGVSIGFKYTNQ